MLTTCSCNSNTGLLHVRFGSKVGESTDHADEWLNWNGAHIHLQRRIQLVESLCNVPGLQHVRWKLGKHRGRLFPYGLTKICDSRFSYLKIKQINAILLKN